jgi:hypothetical protein
MFPESRWSVVQVARDDVGSASGASALGKH